MKSIRILKPLFFAALAGTLWVAPGRAAALTPDQAVAIARTFCGQVGATVTVAPQVYPPSSGVQKMPTNWQAQWKVEFTDQADVEIADPSGMVVGFSNTGLINSPLEMQPIGDAISEADAVARATAAVQATGQPMGEITFESTLLTPTPDAPGQTWRIGDRNWYVHWDRVLQGVPYRDQGAVVTILPETGGVIGLGIAFRTPPVAGIETNVGSDTGAAAALRHMASVGAGDYLFDQVTEEIVTPVRGMMGRRGHLFYVGPPAGQSLPEGQRAAWICLFEGPDYTTAFIFVDAGTGGIIGGDLTGLRAARMRGMPSDLLRSLQRAKEVDVYRRGGRYGWAKQPALRLSRPSDLGLFRELEASDAASPGKTVPASACRIGEAGPRPFPMDVFYLPDQGLLGVPGEW